MVTNDNCVGTLADGLEVLHNTKAPFPSYAPVKNGFNESQPIYGFKVTASAGAISKAAPA